jgi:hypothetical protein
LIERGCATANTINLGPVDLDSLKQEVLTQLRKDPKNINETAREFIVSEALLDKRVSDLLKDTKYQIHCCIIFSELGNNFINYSYGITFQLNEKDLVSVVYDLQQEKITIVKIDKVYGSSSGEEIPSARLSNRTNSVPLTLFPVTPKCHIT